MRSRTEQQPPLSALLTAEENAAVLNMIGPRAQSLATTVAQVYHSEGPGHSYRWNKRSCGVVCFVKDNLKRSYFIRVFDMDNQLLVFEQEVYNQLKYKTPRPYFHTFEGDDAQVGLNFADEREAELFHQTVESKLAERRSRRERRQAGGNGINNNGNAAKLMAAPPPPTPASSVVVAAPPPPPLPVQQQQMTPRKESGGGGRSKGGDNKKQRLKKEDIGMPTNFQHISHVGWDPNRGFDLENVDPNLKKFFQKAGVDEKALQDKDTRDFIYDFIDKHGGVEAALREVSASADSPPILPSAAPPPPPRSLGSSSSRPPAVQAAQQPPSFNRPAVLRNPPPAPPALAPPPPVPIQSAAPPPPPPVAAAAHHPTAAPPPPPPPPPPPLPPPAVSAPGNSTSMAGPPPPPPPPPSLPPVKDSHVDLMEEIRRGGTLKHVSPEKIAAGGGGGDTRNELMGQIRQGVTLKRVTETASGGGGGEMSGSGEAPAGIAGMLQRALQERGMVMGMSSSEEESDGCDEDDEWDD